MMYSKQKIFCNACGVEMFKEIPRVIGGYSGFKVCSQACIREMRWREALSILGNEYRPDPESHKE